MSSNVPNLKVLKTFPTSTNEEVIFMAESSVEMTTRDDHLVLAEGKSADYLHSPFHPSAFTQSLSSWE